MKKENFKKIAERTLWASALMASVGISVALCSRIEKTWQMSVLTVIILLISIFFDWISKRFLKWPYNPEKEDEKEKPNKY